MTIYSPDLARLRPAARAELIYATARTRSDETLWRSLMTADLPPAQSAATRPDRLAGLDALLQALGAGVAEGERAPAPSFANQTAGTSELGNLGPNQVHSQALATAAARTGLPPAALAAIVDAESAKTADGRWNVMSRNPRSSAAGIGQFLSGTWIAEAERGGTWLNDVARAQGWLDGRGRVRPGARTALLALRYEPRAAVEATADYARAKLSRLTKAGVAVGDDAKSVARAAYLAHHLGPGDALRFLRGGLPIGRAERLLAAQIGSGGAVRRIAAAGDAAVAHRQWLLGFVERRVRVDQFTA